MLAPGNGLERGRNGGSGIRAAIALPALLGKLGQGNGIALAAGNAFPKTPDKLQRPDLLPAGTRTLTINDIGRHLAEDDVDPPLRALFIYNHNPIVVHPDQNRMRRGLAREDLFAVGIELTMTESMAYCDVVLPAASHFEYDELYPSYGHHWLQRAEPVIPPVGKSLPNTEIFRRLAARFGFTEPCFRATDAELMDDAVDGADPRLGGLRPSQIPTRKAVPMTAPDGKPLVLFDNVFPSTPSGKVELKSEVLAERWGEAALLPTWRDSPAPYPLKLISPASDKRISSTLGHLAGSRRAPPLLMHPQDAAQRRLEAGAEVRLWNDRGEVVLRLQVTDAVPPGRRRQREGGVAVDQPHRADDLGPGRRRPEGRPRHRRLLQRHPGRGRPGLRTFERFHGGEPSQTVIRFRSASTIMVRKDAREPQSPVREPRYGVVQGGRAVVRAARGHHVRGSRRSSRAGLRRQRQGDRHHRSEFGPSV